ncbi:topoisomerase (plasmid) [Sphingobium yanoikuyae]|uniref:Topoisomerase n=1 Tax=Sphingobium yanoikuyae TaxID=13690 RepID=A0A3G2ULN4_SPHYA|nr:topoisomerase [Sphingobium yanoikuyae]
MPLISNHPTPNLRALVARLGGKWSGWTAMCRCPSHADRTPSLSIRQGDRGILVTCHAGCDATDVLRALRRIADLPIIGPAETSGRQARPPSAHLAIWQGGRPIEGTLAERYVREVRHICAPLGDLRYHPRCPRGQGRLVEFEPALLIAMRKAGNFVAIQRIFLDPVSAGYTEKLVLGRAIGAAWTNGPPSKTIGLCEGFETAAAYTSLTGIQAWASMGAKRFHQVEMPASVAHVILLADNDPEGRRAEARARETLARPGLMIDTEWPPRRMNDWAQLLKR